MIQIGGLIVFESESFLYIWIENRGASLELSRRDEQTGNQTQHRDSQTSANRCTSREYGKTSQDSINQTIRRRRDTSRNAITIPRVRTK
jgi:hypothetical protein